MNATDRADDQSGSDSHAHHVVGSTSPEATPPATPMVLPPADFLATDQARVGNHTMIVGGDPLDSGHDANDPHWTLAGVDLFATDHDRLYDHCPIVGGDLSTLGHTGSDAQMRYAEGNSQPPVHDASKTQRGVDGWLELRIWSEQLEDAMAARIAATNRAERGGVDPTVYRHYLDALEAAEAVCLLSLKRCYRRVVPGEIVAWQKTERGIGDKLTARLLGHLGDPCIATPHRWEGTGPDRVLIAGEPYERTIAQLWSYCGVGDPTRRKQKGMTADDAFALGNPKLKMLLHLHAECCVKAGSGTYRDVYDDARETYADRVHAADCIRCGPSGKPAVEGSPWSKGHQHAAALRKVAKEILRDLWRVRHAALCPPTRSSTSSNDGTSAGTLERQAS